MNIPKQIEYWEKGAESDLEVAQILIGKTKYLQGLFFCHLTIEKILKAHYVKVNSKLAPKTHSFIYLVDNSNLTLTEMQSKFLADLMKYQIEGRYPEYMPAIPSEKKSKEILSNTKEFLKWLIRKL